MKKNRVLRARLRPTRLGHRIGGGSQNEQTVIYQQATELITRGSIDVTSARASRLLPIADRLVTYALRGDSKAKTRARSIVRDREVVEKLFAKANSGIVNGYTKVANLPDHNGKPMVRIFLVFDTFATVWRPQNATRNLRSIEMARSAAGEARKAAAEDTDRTGVKEQVLVRRNGDIQYAELERLAKRVGVQILHYGDSASWTLGSRLIRDSIDEPALIRFVRSGADREGFEVHLAWAGSDIEQSVISELETSLNDGLSDLPG